MNGTYKNLYLCCLTEEQKARTCGYWYTITHEAIGHTAFRTKAALLEWIENCGLKLEMPLPEKLGQHSCQKLIGEYSQKMHMSYDNFYALPAIKEVRCLSNGAYTMGRITETDGIRTIHTLNPNCHHRPEFDYRLSQTLQDCGDSEIKRDKWAGIACRT